MTIGYCHVKAGDFRMTSGFLITMGGTLNLHKIVYTPEKTSITTYIIDADNFNLEQEHLPQDYIAA